MVKTISVAYESLIGPRAANQDDVYANVANDDSWVIAVADGLGGHERGEVASKLAIKAIPSTIDSHEQMKEVFRAGHNAVSHLADPHFRHSFSGLRHCPMTTLCVVAGAADGKHIVAWMGDTIAVAFHQLDDGSYLWKSVGKIHRYTDGSISKCLGYGPPREEPYENTGMYGPSCRFDSDTQLPKDATHGFIAMSDGVWESIMYGCLDKEEFDATDDPIGSAMTKICAAEYATADDVVTHIMDKAQFYTLQDNASVAAVLIKDA